MALYEELAKADVIGPIAAELENGSMSIDPDTKRLKIQRYSIAVPRPWLYGATDIKRKCPIWERIHFYKYGMIPSPCLGCWKVSYGPPNLKKAFETYDLLLRLGKRTIPRSGHTFYGKVGAETRPHTGRAGKFTAMFYSPLGKDLDFARGLRDELEKHICAQVDADARPKLKRGCTEFEQRFPPSDAWEEYYEKLGWGELEARVNSLVPLYSRKPRQQDIVEMQIHVKKRMIEHAFEHGDLTYLEFVERPLVAPLVNYARSEHMTSQFKMGCYTTSKFEPAEVKNDSQRFVDEESEIRTVDSGEEKEAQVEDNSSNIIRMSELE